MQWQNVDIQIPEAKIQTRIKELEKLEQLVSPLILKGPTTDTYGERGERTWYFWRTLYRYIDQGVWLGNSDLRRRLPTNRGRRKKEISEAFESEIS